jgi:hypothetical protein
LNARRSSRAAPYRPGRIRISLDRRRRRAQRHVGGGLAAIGRVQSLTIVSMRTT